MSLQGDLEEAKAKSAIPRTIRKIDRWLDEHPESRKELEAAGAWFSENRDGDFGWVRFTEGLVAKWEDFPKGPQSVSGWFIFHYPELFS